MNKDLEIREFYLNKIKACLPYDFMNIKYIYKITETKATLDNLHLIEKYINKKNFFCLSRMNRMINTYIGEFGEDFDCDIYQVYLLIKEDRQIEFVIILVAFSEGYKSTLIKFIKTSPFCYKLYFLNRFKIYPF